MAHLQLSARVHSKPRYKYNVRIINAINEFFNSVLQSHFKLGIRGTTCFGSAVVVPYLHTEKIYLYATNEFFNRVLRSHWKWHSTKMFFCFRHCCSIMNIALKRYTSIVKFCICITSDPSLFSSSLYLQKLRLTPGKIVSCYNLQLSSLNTESIWIMLCIARNDEETSDYGVRCNTSCDGRTVLRQRVLGVRISILVVVEDSVYHDMAVL